MDHAVGELKGQLGGGAEIAIVLGSGMKSLVDRLEIMGRHSFAKVPGMVSASVPGHAGEFVRGRLGDTTVIVQSGRVHYYEASSMADVIWPTRILGHLGVTTLLLTNAAGGIRADLVAGSLMAIDDHINFMGTTPLRGLRLDETERFVDMTEAYDRELLSTMERCAHEIGVGLARGVYFAVSGPQFETPAEIRMARTLGGDAVGMSTVPEVTVARALGMRVGAISVITNRAAGLQGDLLSHEETLHHGKQAEPRLTRLLERVCRTLDGGKRP